MQKTPFKLLTGIGLIAALLSFSIPLSAAIRFRDFDELSDRDLSPDGRWALNQMQDMVWYHAETRHFIYHFTSTDPAFECYLQDSEKYYAEIKTLFGVTQDDWQKRVHLFVFQKEWAWKNLAEHFHIRPQILAFTEGWELFIRHPADDQSRIKTIAHELAHIILFRFVDGVPPLFLNEGFADYMSLGATADFLGVDRSRIRHSRKMTSAEYIPLSSLSALDHYPDKGLENFYLESELFTRYLINQFGGDKFYRLVKDTAHGKGFRESLRSIYNKSIEDIEPDFRTYLLEGA